MRGQPLKEGHPFLMDTFQLKGSGTAGGGVGVI